MSTTKSEYGFIASVRGELNSELLLRRRPSSWIDTISSGIPPQRDEEDISAGEVRDWALLWEEKLNENVKVLEDFGLVLNLINRHTELFPPPPRGKGLNALYNDAKLHLQIMHNTYNNMLRAAVADHRAEALRQRRVAMMEDKKFHKDVLAFIAAKERFERALYNNTREGEWEEEEEKEEKNTLMLLKRILKKVKRNEEKLERLLSENKGGGGAPKKNEGTGTGLNTSDNPTPITITSLDSNKQASYLANNTKEKQRGEGVRVQNNSGELVKVVDYIRTMSPVSSRVHFSWKGYIAYSASKLDRQNSLPIHRSVPIVWVENKDPKSNTPSDALRELIKRKVTNKEGNVSRKQTNSFVNMLENDYYTFIENLQKWEIDEKYFKGVALSCIEVSKNIHDEMKTSFETIETVTQLEDMVYMHIQTFNSYFNVLFPTFRSMEGVGSEFSSVLYPVGPLHNQLLSSIPNAWRETVNYLTDTNGENREYLHNFFTFSFVGAISDYVWYEFLQKHRWFQEDEEETKTNSFYPMNITKNKDNDLVSIKRTDFDNNDPNFLFRVMYSFVKNLFCIAHFGPYNNIYLPHDKFETPHYSINWVGFVMHGTSVGNAPTRKNKVDNPVEYNGNRSKTEYDSDRYPFEASFLINPHANLFDIPINEDKRIPAQYLSNMFSKKSPYLGVTDELLPIPYFQKWNSLEKLEDAFTGEWTRGESMFSGLVQLKDSSTIYKEILETTQQQSKREVFLRLLYHQNKNNEVPQPAMKSLCSIAGPVFILLNFLYTYGIGQDGGIVKKISSFLEKLNSLKLFTETKSKLYINEIKESQVYYISCEWDKLVGKKSGEVNYSSSWLDHFIIAVTMCGQYLVSTERGISFYGMLDQATVFIDSILEFEKLPPPPPPPSEESNKKGGWGSWLSGFAT